MTTSATITSSSFFFAGISRAISRNLFYSPPSPLKYPTPPKRLFFPRRLIFFSPRFFRVHIFNGQSRIYANNGEVDSRKKINRKIQLFALGKKALVLKYCAFFNTRRVRSELQFVSLLGPVTRRSRLEKRRDETRLYPILIKIFGPLNFCKALNFNHFSLFNSSF